MLCIGHRGAMGHEPENTLLSIRKAIELGVDAIEIDLYNVEDRLVAIHDRDLSRTTNGKGYIDDCSFEYLRSLDAGKGERVPTLKEVLATVDRQVRINLELKGSNTAELAADSILECLNQGWRDQDFVVSSFNHYELNQFKKLAPNIDIGMLIYGLPWRYIDLAKELGSNVVVCGLDYVNSRQVENIHQEELQVWVYTVNRPQDINAMQKLQVDGIFTNYPDLFHEQITNK
ncbi:MAG: glycerophosphodiester phosphodiesterase [Cyanobacteria bacterium P01_G01_bin.19]